MVTRITVILGLVLQSFLLLCCGGGMHYPAAAPSECCAQSEDAGCDCCSHRESKLEQTKEPKLSASCLEGCGWACECSVSADSPRVPPKSERKIADQPPRPAGSGVAIELPRLSENLKIVLRVEPPPPRIDSGRRACEEFCRWTI